jgi:CO/xanthine dehydrogenase FAD-binding subunit
MIVEYLRPNTLNEAIQYLQRKEPITLPLGGGNLLSKYQETPIAVVDLQNLGLNQIIRENGKIEIGASVSLSGFETFMNNEVFSNALRIQAGKNQRNTSTVAGLVCMADGRSTFLTLLLTLDAQLNWQPGDKLISLGNWLPQ